MAIKYTEYAMSDFLTFAWDENNYLKPISYTLAFIFFILDFFSIFIALQKLNLLYESVHFADRG